VRGRGGDKGGDKYIHLLAFGFAVRRFSIPSGPDRRALMAGRGPCSLFPRHAHRGRTRVLHSQIVCCDSTYDWLAGGQSSLESPGS
jgi:anti-sigma factor ChrR (cupin superfamily)